MTSSNQQHECQKPDCYFCYYTNPKPRKVTVINPVVNKLSFNIWKQFEIATLCDNVLLTINKLCKIIPTRTRKAIIKKRCDLAKDIGIEYIAKEWRWAKR